MLDFLSPNQIKLASWTLAVYVWFSCPYDGGGGPGNKTYLVIKNFKLLQNQTIRSHLYELFVNTKYC